MKLTCPKCGTVIESGAAAPGTPVACSCGNVLQVPKKRRLALWLILGGVAAAGCVPCVGIMAAIAIPNFIRFQARSKRSECKATLKAFASAQATYFEANQGYTEDLAELGFSPERGNRYAYFSSWSEPMQDRSGPELSLEGPYYGIGIDVVRHKGAAELGVGEAEETVEGEAGVIPGLSGECPECDVTMVCVGNVDQDDTLDVWSVSTGDRELVDGTQNPAGEPLNHVNDVEE